MTNIIVVDDHPAICFALKAILGKNPDFHISTANDGVTAMALVKELAPSLVILDIALTKMDGLEILQRMRRHDSTAKVLILSGQNSELYAERACRAGANGYLSKDEELSHLPTLCNLILAGYSCFPTFLMTRLMAAAQTPVGSPLEKLSDREITVLRYLAAGLTNKEIATRLLLSNKTISTYKTRLMEKLNITDSGQIQKQLEDILARS
ncbi:response regulator [Erwinia sp.]|uniref:response regulator n=1 Tax=Erwinia citreus TaxID=558 RepID=UPI003C70A23E